MALPPVWLEAGRRVAGAHSGSAQEPSPSRNSTLAGREASSFSLASLALQHASCACTLMPVHAHLCVLMLHIWNMCGWSKCRCEWVEDANKLRNERFHMHIFSFSLYIITRNVAHPLLSVRVGSKMLDLFKWFRSRIHILWYSICVCNTCSYISWFTCSLYLCAHVNTTDGDVDHYWVISFCILSSWSCIWLSSDKTPPTV